MNILYNRRFHKCFQVLDEKVKRRFYERLKLFLKNPNSPQLQNHPLKGNLVGYRAFSVTGDYRVIYRFTAQDEIELTNIGRHSKVY